MNSNRFILSGIVAIMIIGFAYMADAPYRKQVKEFTETCHKNKGVVIQEHDTKNLLCFPSDA